LDLRIAKHPIPERKKHPLEHFCSLKGAQGLVTFSDDFDLQVLCHVKKVLVAEATRTFLANDYNNATKL